VLSSFEPLAAAGLAVGDRIARGTVLGVVGEGAHCSGACLHVGVRVDGEYVSPLLFFDRVPRSVLLPLRGGEGTAPTSRRLRLRRADGRCGRSP
jgi:murein DD-endopeptidase MepM/ murein hydrolase activator NlpD